MEQRVELLKQRFMEQISACSGMEDDSLLEEIDRLVLAEGKAASLSLFEKERCRKELFDSIRRLDILQELLDNPEVSEIMVNGSKKIFVEKGNQIRLWNRSFESDEKLEDVIQRMASRMNRIVNETSPIVDLRLGDGSRVNVVLPPVSLEGPIITIRKFGKGISMEFMEESGMLPKSLSAFLKKLVFCGFNIFISGGTNSGKTTFLNALSEFIPSDERIITIEDAAELQITGIPNIVRLETRNSNMEGRNQIPMDMLIKTALRMRPSRIIVGEVRGAEVLDMMQAMNTGHDGSMSTGHANSSRDMLARLEAMALMGGDIPIYAVKSQICSAIEIMIHLKRMPDGRRKVVSVMELEAFEGNQIKLNSIYDWREDKDTGEEEFKKRLKRQEKVHWRET